MKNRAINALVEMGMPADIKGFQYIVDAMCLFEEKEWRKITEVDQKIVGAGNAVEQILIRTRLSKQSMIQEQYRKERHSLDRKKKDLTWRD